MSDKEKLIPARLQIGDRILKGEVKASFANAPVSGMVLHVGEEAQTEPIELSDLSLEEKEAQLADFVFQGKMEKVAKIGNKIKVVFETFDGEAMLNDVDTQAPGIVPPETALRKWDLDYEMIRTLARGIKSFDGKAIGETREAREKYILKLPWSIVLYLGGEWNKFMAEINALLQSDAVGDLLRK